MIDKLKSVVLTLLVGLSLFQSYQLVYSRPDIESSQTTEYIKTELIGTQSQVEDLLYPSDIILHFGDSTHTVLTPNITFYKMILDVVTARTFDGLEPNTKWIVNWDQIRDERQGFELHFRQGIPMDVLQRFMQVQDDELVSYNIIHSIWFVVSESGEEVRTFFVTEDGIRMFEATNSILTVRELQRFVELGAYLTRYQYEPRGNFYLPEEDVNMIRYETNFTTFTPEQLQNSLFVNPSITRNIIERDGTEIYTDGKRGLQINKDQLWMSFSDPIAPGTGGMDILDNLFSAVKFVNQHGGWNGTFTIDHLPELGNSVLTFRQYYEGFPIVDIRETGLGSIQVNLNNSIVSSYERSLVNLDEEPTSKSPVLLEGGEVLLQRLERYSRLNEVLGLYAGYRPVMGEQSTVTLLPEWIVELQDGTLDYLN
jgi:regulatory protein YycH of two-component signal transduction system YycFG